MDVRWEYPSSDFGESVDKCVLEYDSASSDFANSTIYSGCVDALVASEPDYIEYSSTSLNLIVGQRIIIGELYCIFTVTQETNTGSSGTISVESGHGCYVDDVTAGDIKLLGNSDDTALQYEIFTPSNTGPYQHTYFT